MIRATHIAKGQTKGWAVTHPEDFNEGLAMIARFLHVGVWTHVTLHHEDGSRYVYDLVDDKEPSDQV